MSTAPYKITATLHMGTAILVKNPRGIPVRVIPITESREMMPRQMLWHTCQEPRTLAVPETVLVIPSTFSSLPPDCISLPLTLLVFIEVIMPTLFK